MSSYYTLTAKGHQWFAGKASPPSHYLSILKELASEVTENDVPRLPSQIAHELGLQEKAVESALSFLTKEGYTQIGHLPQPIEKAETPKPRIKPIEEIVESEIRAQEARKRYDSSEKGVIAHIRYELSEKGEVKNKRYWGERGRLIQKKFRITRNIRSMLAAQIDKKLIEVEKKKLKEVERELSKE